MPSQELFFNVQDDQNGNPVVTEVEPFDLNRDDLHVWAVGLTDKGGSIEIPCYMVFPGKTVSAETFWKPGYTIQAHGDNSAWHTPYAEALSSQMRERATRRGLFSG